MWDRPGCAWYWAHQTQDIRGVTAVILKSLAGLVRDAARGERARPDQVRAPGIGPAKVTRAARGSASQCDDTNTASSNGAGIANCARMRFVSCAGVRPNSRLNSRLNCDALA